MAASLIVTSGNFKDLRTLKRQFLPGKNVGRKFERESPVRKG
jgi:hypothetical protein